LAWSGNVSLLGGSAAVSRQRRFAGARHREVGSNEKLASQGERSANARARADAGSAFQSVELAIAAPAMAPKDAGVD
jgi:hypothetical protein